MPRIEAQPESLAAASARASALAEELRSLSGPLDAAASSMAGALGDAGGAVAEVLSGWSGVLGELAGTSTGLGRNLAGAASAYLDTDRTAMPGPGGE